MTILKEEHVNCQYLTYTILTFLACKNWMPPICTCALLHNVTDNVHPIIIDTVHTIWGFFVCLQGNGYPSPTAAVRNFPAGSRPSHGLRPQPEPRTSPTGQSSSSPPSHTSSLGQASPAGKATEGLGPRWGSGHYTAIQKQGRDSRTPRDALPEDTSRIRDPGFSDRPSPVPDGRNKVGSRDMSDLRQDDNQHRGSGVPQGEPPVPGKHLHDSSPTVARQQWLVDQNSGSPGRARIFDVVNRTPSSEGSGYQGPAGTMAATSQSPDLRKSKHLHELYGDSEDSEASSTTPPLPALSPSNTPPITPPGTPPVTRPQTQTNHGHSPSSHLTNKTPDVVTSASAGPSGSGTRRRQGRRTGGVGVRTWDGHMRKYGGGRPSSANRMYPTKSTPIKSSRIGKCAA